jgi:hypothetical protein
MSQTKVQLVSNIVGNVSGGASFTGIVTASSFTGNLTGTASTASFATTSFGLSGSPNITVGNVTGAAATFTGNVSIAGTLTYEDVTNVDSVGVITARNGIVVSAGGINATGVITATSFSGSGANLTGISSVSFATTSFALSGSPAILVSSAGINTIEARAKLYLQGNAAANIVGLGTTSGTVTLDFTQGNNFSMTLTAGTTLANPTGVTTGQSGVLFIQEDGTGGYTVAWGTSWDFASSTAPTLTTTANALNALPYFARSTTSIVVGSVIAGIGTL